MTPAPDRAALVAVPVLRSTDCRWCALLPQVARGIVLAAALAGKPHPLGSQCWRCQRTAWGMRSLNLAIREIEAAREGRAG